MSGIDALLKEMDELLLPPPTYSIVLEDDNEGEQDNTMDALVEIIHMDRDGNIITEEEYEDLASQNDDYEDSECDCANCENI